MGRPSNTEERRAQIVEALAAVMAGVGYEHATIAAIAKRAGLAPGLVHYHFTDKEEILVALVETLARRLEARIDAKLGACEPNARARLHALLDAHLGLGADADPNAVAAWTVVATEATRRPEVRALYRKAIVRTLARVEELLRAALRDAGKSTRTAGEIAAALVAAMQGAYLVHASAPGVLRRGYAAPALRALVDGVLAERASGPTSGSPSDAPANRGPRRRARRRRQDDPRS